MILTDYDLDPMNNNKRQIRRRRGIAATARGPCPRAFYAYIIIMLLLEDNPANWSDVEKKNLHIIIIIITSDDARISRMYNDNDNNNNWVLRQRNTYV